MHGAHGAVQAITGSTKQRHSNKGATETRVDAPPELREARKEWCLQSCVKPDSDLAHSPRGKNGKLSTRG